MPAAMSRTSDVSSFIGMPAIIVSECMRDLMRRIERIAQTNAAVLITGESGAGKEIVARAIHHYSLRCAKPWVDISCAALPEHLVESELFGYERGAFSGADSQKAGLFELAHTGTLFLDEVGELDRKLQVKLLRVLDGTPYYRLGGVKKVCVDVRIVAATNQDLEEAACQGNFRRDLYHRLSQIRVDVPPLRDRRADIVPLAEFFLRQQGEQYRFSLEALMTLQQYAWPGNVRELRNVVIRSAAVADTEIIEAVDLPRYTSGPERLSDPCDGCNLAAIERRMIEDVLTQTGGHHRKAAELLGISTRTLSRKLKSYGFEERVERCIQ